MPFLYVTEYSDILQVAGGRMQIVKAPAIAEQKVDFTAGVTASAAFNLRTKAVRLHTDSICSVSVGGTAPVATTSMGRMAAGQTEYFGVVGGDKVSVITNT
jgi:hypothetical protein